MLRYFRLPTGHAHTVNTMVAEAYALTEPGTVGTEDPTRRDGAIDALRALNAGLPVDNDTVITLPFVWLKRVVRIPFRIPDVGPAALRPAFADLKVHDLYALTRMTAAFVHTRLPEGTATLAEVRRLMDICRLLKIRGMSVDIAVALHDHTPPIKAPREVYETDQATLKAIIEAADPTMPASLLELRPWFTLQRNARRHAPRTPTGRPPRFVGAFPAGVLAREITFWEDESTNPARRRTERVSAEIVAFLFRVQRQIAHGNARFARGDGRKAYGYFRRIWVLLGERALALGLIDPSSVEVTGPSLETILHTCGELLRKLDPADAAHARTRLSAPPERAGEGLQSLRLTDLEPSLHQEVMGALAEQPMWALGRRGLRRSLASLSDSTVGEISTSESEFTEGLATTNHMARVADLRIHDREVLVENLGAASVLQFSEKFANTWETYASSIELNDIEAVAGASLGSPAPLALEVVRGDVIEAYPSPLPESLRAFDRFFAWRPASRPDSAPRYVPVNETFSEAYRTVILPFLRDERVQDVWQFPISDFADPARFAFLLPALVARPLRNNLASTLNPSGRWDVVFDMQRGAAGHGHRSAHG